MALDAPSRTTNLVLAGSTASLNVTVGRKLGDTPVLPSAGVNPITTGGVASTVTDALAGAEFPAASKATAVTVAWPPAGEFPSRRRRAGARRSNGPTLTPVA